MLPLGYENLAKPSDPSSLSSLPLPFHPRRGKKKDNVMDERKEAYEVDVADRIIMRVSCFILDSASFVRSNNT